MRMILISVVALVAAKGLVIPASANGSFVLQAQYGLNAGFNQQTQTQACASGAPYQQCGGLPGEITGYAGTLTIKQPGVEVLLQIACGAGTVIWQGELKTPVTLPIVSPTLPTLIPGPCWIAWQADSDNFISPGAAFEVQFSVFYQDLPYVAPSLK